MSGEKLNTDALDTEATAATETERVGVIASKGPEGIVLPDPPQDLTGSTGGSVSGNDNGNGNGKRDRDNVDDNDDDTEENATKQFKSSDDSDNATSGGTGMLSGRSSASNEEQQAPQASTAVISTQEVTGSTKDDDDDKQESKVETDLIANTNTTSSKDITTSHAIEIHAPPTNTTEQSSIKSAPIVEQRIPDSTTSVVTTDPRITTASSNTVDAGYGHQNAATTDGTLEEMIEETGVVSAMYVGRVIGKGGEMIRDLQARSGARIDVDQNVPIGQPRVITYRGTRATVEFAKQLVKLLSTDGVSESELPLGKASREFVIIPANSVGKVIGRGGEMIRELQSRSQAKIQIDHTGQSGLNPDEKQVTVTGTLEAVVKAKEMILLLVENPLVDAQQSLNMLVEEKNRGLSKWGSGPPYTSLPNQGVNMQPHMLQQSQHQGMPQAYGMYGQQTAPIMQHGNPMMMGEYPAQQQSTIPYGAPPMGGYPHVQPQLQTVSYLNDGRESEVLFVSKQYMGRIIGSKGVTINDLQRRSACDIQINQDVPPGKDCEVTMKGTRQGIDHAKSMIQEIIDVGPNHPYAGGIENYGMRNTGGYHGGAQQQHHHQHNYHNQQAQYNPYQQQQPPTYDQSGAYAQQVYPPQVNPGGYNAPMMGTQPYVQQPMQPMQQQQPIPYQQTLYVGGSGMGNYTQTIPQQMPIANATIPRQPQAPTQPVQAVSQWKVATAQNGQVYYYNERTGETQWDKPLGMP